VEESSQTDDSSQVEIIRDPELVCDLSEIPYTAKCTVEGNFGAGAKLSDYYGINAMINSDEPLLSIPVKYTDADFGGGVIRFEFSDKISDEQKASAVISLTRIARSRNLKVSLTKMAFLRISPRVAFTWS